MASVTIAELELQITSSTNQAVNGINSLITTLNSLKETVKGGLRLKLVTDQINKLGMAIKLFPNLNKLEQLRDILAQIKGIGNVDITKGFETSSKVKQARETKKWLQDLIGLNAALAKDQQSQQNQTNTITNTQENKNETFKKGREYFSVSSILKANSEVKLLNEQLKELKINLLEANKAGDKEKVQQYASKIHQVQKQLQALQEPTKRTTNLIGKFMKSLGRIAMYRLIRFILKEIITAFKEGTNNLYQFSKAMDGSFAQSMDKIASSVLTIRNSLGVALAPLLEALTPIIERLSESFMKFGNTISQVSAIINGKSTYTKAIKSIKEYAEETEKAKNATQGFDELNIAQKDSVDVSTMFEETEVGEVTDSAKTLLDIISSIKQIVVDVVNIIKDVFAPLLEPILKLVGTIVKIVLDAVHEILQGDGFKELLSNIVNVVTSIIGQIIANLPTIKRIIEVIVKLVNMILNAINQIIGDGIEKAENSTTTIFTIIGGIVELIDIILDLIQPILDIVVRIVSLVTGIVDMVLKAVQPILEGIFDILQPIVRLVVDLLVSALEPIAPILDYFIEVIGGVLSPILEEMGVYLKPLLEWIQMALTTIGGLIGGIAKFFSGALTDAIEGVVKIFKLFVAIFSGDTEQIKDAWSAVGEHFQNVWKRMWDNIKNVFVKIINGIIGGFEKFVNALIDAVNWLTDKFSKIWTWTGLDGIPQASHVTFNRLNGYAQGGYGIPKGQMFIANEQGAEMVGSMDGKTAVANNQQIVEGIKQGVYDAFMSAMDSQPDRDGNINLAVYLDGRQIKSEIDRISQGNGVSIAGGLAYYG